ncbi:hypothetical protein FYK55_27240 [Roseiconus nitratireducens]|uniref:Uncharacterized protein n=1 Tax=Roseiconus nitratireducens TaxID=2605748 RepID=A0A5M6D0B4_9BACT|nr:hypothetical protein [Roseiconus nitratireducens]KAA5538585.1 hypothetical protein FYK55_27240 [Roseiconus nitratireducens]
MHKTPMITDEEREQLQPLLSLIPDPDRLYACTMSGEFFDCHDHALMAFQIWRRMGRNNESTGAAWRRLMQSDCPNEDVMAFVAFHVFNGMNIE